MSIRVIPQFNGTFDQELVVLHGACSVKLSEHAHIASLRAKLIWHVKRC